MVSGVSAMRCGVCATVNGPDARFCSACGNRLDHLCPTCAAPYEPGARFCSQCGTALDDAAANDEIPDDLSRYVPEELLRKVRAARSGRAMRGERRTVTMLFADIQGSTAAAGKLDPEEWAEIINGAFGHLIGPVYRYEGTLARLQGDAILAFFGAPLAHEDDPIRAVHAGLAIVEEFESYRAAVEQQHGVRIGVRVGINTGLVVVGEVGSDLRVEYTALGDAINVASRVEQSAEVGTVRVTDDTLALLGSAFHTEAIGPVEVRGKDEPVATHRIIAPATAEDVPSAVAVLVGRDAALRALEAVSERLAGGTGAVVTITGEAGIGKSGLLVAWHAALGRRSEVATTIRDSGAVAWVAGHARSYDRLVPYATFVEVLRGWWSIEDTTDVHAAVAAALGDATQASDPLAAALLAAMLDAPVPEDDGRILEGLAPPTRAERTIVAVLAHVAAEARRRPLLLVLDDLHWADALTLTLVERLMALTATVPLGLVLGLRPVRDEAVWRLVEAAARDHAHRSTAIELTALPDEASEALLLRLLGDVRVDREVRSAILERAGGNPLFLEEIVRSIREADDPDRGHQRPADVPRSLTGLLTSRLDRLDEVTRTVAQIASVIGREFSLGTLRLIDDRVDVDLGHELEDLVRRGILEERGRIPQPVYAFRHPLIRDTAYETILLRDRRELHRRLAEHLVAEDPDAVHAIAGHLRGAGDDAAAFPYLVEAGRRSVAKMSLHEAIDLFDAALASPPAGADPELLRLAHIGLGEAYALIPDLTRTAAAYQSMREYGRTSSQPHVEVTALNQLGFAQASIAGDYDGARELLDEARRMAEDVGDELGLAEYHMNSCFVESMSGEFDRAVEHDDEVARLGDDLGDQRIRTVGLVRKAMNLFATWRFDEARDTYESARAIATASGDAETEAILDANVGAPLVLRGGDLAGAMELLTAALPIIDLHTSLYGSSSHHQMAECAVLAGDPELALHSYARTCELGELNGQTFAVAAGYSGRAMVLTALGLPESAADARAAALAALEAPAGHFFAATVWADLAEAQLASGDHQAAHDAVRRALTAPGTNTRWEQPRALLTLARSQLAAGDHAAAREALDESRTLVATHALRLHEPQLFLLDGDLAAREGRRDDAATLLTEAVATAVETGRVVTRAEALRRLAEVRAEAGEQEEAADLRGRADRLLGDLAGRIADEGLRTAFRSAWHLPAAAG